MSTLAHLSTSAVIVSRLTTTSGYKKNYATTTGMKVTIQQLSQEKTALIDGVMGKTYVVYADGSLDLQEGDRLRDNSTQELYQVKNGGVTRRTFGMVDYREVIVEKIN